MYRRTDAKRSVWKTARNQLVRGTSKEATAMRTLALSVQLANQLELAMQRQRQLFEN